jgi:hypothetical protein
MNDKFDTTPKVEFFRALENQNWNVTGALSELVDNSFGPVRGNATEVTISYDKRKQIITVLDNGQGMDALGRLFQLGATIGRGPKDIGVYGAGGTMALLWLARAVHIWTMRNGKVSHDQVDWSKQIAKGEFPLISNDWERATPSNMPPELFTCGHGTFIRLELRHERKGFLPHNTMRDLRKTYAPGLRQGKRIIWNTVSQHNIEQTVLDAESDVVFETGKSVAVDAIIEVEHDTTSIWNPAVRHLPIIGSIGVVKDLPVSKSKISIGYGYREILDTRDCYQNDDERYSGTGITGYIDLSDEWAELLTTTKNGVNDRPAWNALMQYIFSRIEWLLKESQEDKMDLFFDDLALSLATMLNGKSQIASWVEVEHREKPHKPSADSTSGPDTSIASESPDDSELPKEKESQVTAGSKILIRRRNDFQMEQRLCFAAIGANNSIEVFVNEDHTLVKSALAAQPPNRGLLIYMVCREISDLLQQHQELLKIAFSKNVLEIIGRYPDETQSQIIHRLLIDRHAETRMSV